MLYPGLLSMKSLLVCAVGAGLLSLLIGTGCSPEMRVGDYECSQLTAYFRGQPYNVRMAQFAAADLEKQYAIYICGNQWLHPPELELADAFARGGGKVVRLLKSKLSPTIDDVTIRDVVMVLAQMSRQRTYDVAGDSELMRTIDKRVLAMKSPYWKSIVKEDLREIRAAHAAARHTTRRASEGRPRI
jgi:hypothetical protein